MPEESPSTTRDGPNTREGTERLVRILKKYWRTQGYNIDAEIVASGQFGRKIVWGIKSDLVNGWPRGYKVPS
jgi:hypothetical protein